MECSICWSSVEGLRTVKCSEPCSMICCEICWKNLENRTKCCKCTRPLPGKYENLDYNSIRENAIGLVCIVVVCLICLPFTSTETTKNCKKISCDEVSSTLHIFPCKMNPEACINLGCQKTCLNLETMKCFDYEEDCKERFDKFTEAFYALMTAMSFYVIQVVSALMHSICYRRIIIKPT